MTNVQFLIRLEECLKSSNDLIAAFRFSSLKDDLKKEIRASIGEVIVYDTKEVEDD